MAYGFHNHMCVPIGNVTALTGNGSSRAVSCAGFYLPVASRLAGISACVRSHDLATAETSVINVLVDGTKVTSSGLSLSSGVTSVANTSIITSYLTSTAGSIFTLCETTESGKILNYCNVTLWFRPQVD